MKHVKIITAILFALVIALGLACDNDTTGPDDGDGGGGGGGDPEPFTYPHSDGAEWVYSGEGDDVRLVFNGYSEHPVGGNCQNLEEWVYDAGQEEWVRNDTLYFRTFDDYYRFYYIDYEVDYEIWLKTSLEVGDSWVFNTVMDWEATVMAQEDVTVPAGTFEDCYKVYYEGQLSGGNNLEFYVWYANGVGGRYGVKRVSDIYDDKELAFYSLPSE